MSRRKKGLKIDGVLLLDKPLGLSSNTALQKARRALDAQKAGHTGTLDPLASGLLPLCFGEATKFSADLLHADKEYITTVKFGETTATGDAEGMVLETKPVTFSLTELEASLAKFRGPIRQIPPMYSALKKDGTPLYELARQGVEIEREPRDVVIEELELLSFEAPFATLRVKCSKGTYIRVLGEDIGKDLGCGAHLTALRRTKIADLDVADAVTLTQFESADSQDRLRFLMPPDRLLSSLDAIELDEQSSVRFAHGQSIPMQDSVKQGKHKVYGTLNGERKLLGCASIDEKCVLIPERLISNLL